MSLGREGRIILCDVDGVLTDFVGAVIQGTGVTRDSITEFDVFSQHPCLRARRADLLRPEWWRALDPLPGAEAFIEALGAYGHVVYCTSPWLACTGWEHARRAWLSEHLEADPLDVVSTSRKGLVSGWTLIDDRGENVEAWQHAQGRQGYLLGATYNRGEHTYASILEDIARRCR